MDAQNRRQSYITIYQEETQEYYYKAFTKLPGKLRSDLASSVVDGT